MNVVIDLVTCWVGWGILDLGVLIFRLSYEPKAFFIF